MALRGLLSMVTYDAKLRGRLRGAEFFYQSEKVSVHGWLDYRELESGSDSGCRTCDPSQQAEVIAIHGKTQLYIGGPAYVEAGAGLDIAA